MIFDLELPDYEKKIKIHFRGDILMPDWDLINGTDVTTLMTDYQLCQLILLYSPNLQPYQPIKIYSHSRGEDFCTLAYPADPWFKDSKMSKFVLEIPATQYARERLEKLFKSYQELLSQQTIN